MRKYHIIANPQRNNDRYLYETYLRCQTPEMGGRILVCDSCGRQVIKYHSCNTRGCEKCGPIRQMRWREKTKRKMLPMGHIHQVFTTPGEFQLIWQLDETRFTNVMFKAIQRAYQEEEKLTGLKLGILMTFQSHGHLLCRHLHMHSIITRGGMAPNGRFIHIQKLNDKRLQKNYYRFFRHELKRQYARDELSYINFWEGNPNMHEYSLHTTYHAQSADGLVGYVSKSLFGWVIAPEDIGYDSERKMALIHDRKTGKTHEMAVLEFTSRMFEHIPARHEVLIRYYGLYSNRYKEQLKRIRKETFGTTLEEIEDAECCSECGSPLRVELEFSREAWPLRLRLIMSRGSPPKHGEILCA